jgi:hypothetical protein
MKLNLHTPGALTSGPFPDWALTAAVFLLVLAGLILLPGPVLFLAALSGAIGIGLTFAELRRHGGPGVPSLPFIRER